MAVRKPTTTADVIEPAGAGREVVAKPEAAEVVRVKSPSGFVTEVPVGIVDALLDSGYSKTK